MTVCATGFASDGEGGCEPVLPAEPCLPGTMEVLGQTECQPIGDCGTGTWGNLTVDAQTRFVDASADASGADGSQAHPYPGLAEALAVVPAGGQVALAAGTYAANLVLERPVRLSGRCASQVTLVGQDQPAVEIQNADLAGALNAAASGTISRSVITDAEFSVVWSNPGLAPEVTADNVLAGTTVSEASLQTALVPAPAPPPVPPSEP